MVPLPSPCPTPGCCLLGVGCLREQRLLPGVEVFLTLERANRADLFPNCLSMGAVKLCLCGVGAGNSARFDRVLSCPSFKALFAFPLPFMSYFLKFQSCTKVQTQDS